MEIEPKKQQKTFLILALIAALTIATGLLVSAFNKRSGVSTTIDSGESPVASGKATRLPSDVFTEPAIEPTNIVFEKTVRLGEPVSLQVRFRDYSTIPDDFASMADLEGKLAETMGEATITARSLKAADPEGEMTVPQGVTYVVSGFDLLGNPNNPVGRLIHPSSVDEMGTDMFPQLVLLKGDDVSHLSTDASRLYARAKGVLGFRQANTTLSQPMSLNAVWDWPWPNQPILAVEYVDARGAKRYIRINY